MTDEMLARFREELATLAHHGLTVGEQRMLLREVEALREIARALATDSLPSGRADWVYCDFNEECGRRAVEMKHGSAQQFVHVDDCPVTKARKLLGLKR